MSLYEVMFYLELAVAVDCFADGGRLLNVLDWALVFVSSFLLILEDYGLALAFS